MEHLRKLKSWEAAILGCSQATEEPLTEAASTPRYALADPCAIPLTGLTSALHHALAPACKHREGA